MRSQVQACQYFVRPVTKKYDSHRVEFFKTLVWQGTKDTFWNHEIQNVKMPFVFYMFCEASHEWRQTPVWNPQAHVLSLKSTRTIMPRSLVLKKRRKIIMAQIREHCLAWNCTGLLKLVSLRSVTSNQHGCTSRVGVQGGQMLHPLLCLRSIVSKHNCISSKSQSKSGQHKSYSTVSRMG